MEGTLLGCKPSLDWCHTMAEGGSLASSVKTDFDVPILEHVLDSQLRLHEGISTASIVDAMCTS